MNRRLFLAVTASFLLGLLFEPALSQTPTRRPSLTYPDRQGQTETKPDSDEVTIKRPNGVAAPSAPDREHIVNVFYDRFEGITWYDMEGLSLTPWNGRSDYAGLSPQLQMTARFGCYGDSGDSPCVPNGIALDFSYSNYYSRGGYMYSYPPFDYQQRSVIALADGRRILLGLLNVTRKVDALRLSVKGRLAVSLQTFRQLASADSVEMKVGIVPVTLASDDLDSLAKFYNFATLNRRTPASHQNGTPTRRGKRRVRRSP